MTNIYKAKLLLRVGLAFVFLYAGISGLLDPFSWVGFFPKFVFTIVSSSVAMPLFSMGEILLGVWILSGKKLFWSATIASISLLLIVLFNLNQFLIVFRDMAILMMAMSLIFLERE